MVDFLRNMASRKPNLDRLRKEHDKDYRGTSLEDERKRKRVRESEHPGRKKTEESMRFTKKPNNQAGAADASSSRVSPPSEKEKEAERKDGETRQKKKFEQMQKLIKKLENDKTELVRLARGRDLEIRELRQDKSETKRLRENLTRSNGHLEKAKLEIERWKSRTSAAGTSASASASAKTGDFRNALDDHILDQKMRKVEEENVCLSGKLIVTQGELTELKSEMNRMKESRKTGEVDDGDHETKKTVMSKEVGILRDTLATLKGQLRLANSEKSRSAEMLILEEARGSLEREDLNDAIVELERLKSKFHGENVTVPVRRQKFSGTSRM